MAPPTPGVRVAVLDSGIDYTHGALGGSGDPADYAANDPDLIEPATFPTAKVESAGSTSSAPPGRETGRTARGSCPDPLDDGPEAGHGTHVGDIIGGSVGVAPAVDSRHEGPLLDGDLVLGNRVIHGMDFAIDPNGDGDSVTTSTSSTCRSARTTVSRSTTTSPLAVDNATALRRLTVASAGNGADKPYVTGTPVTAPRRRWCPDAGAVGEAPTDQRRRCQPIPRRVQPWDRPR